MQCAATTGERSEHRERATCHEDMHACRERAQADKAETADVSRQPASKLSRKTLRAAGARAAHSPARPESRESAHAPGKYLETQDHEPARADFRRQSLRRSPPAFTWPVSLGSLPHFIEVDERRMRQHKRAERLRRSHMRAAAPPEHRSAAAPPRYERAAAPQEREGAAAPPEREERLRRCSTQQSMRQDMQARASARSRCPSSEREQRHER